MTQSVSSKSIQSLAASKVSGALPAVNGSALTGISAGVYNNASDPTITSNRALGTLWANSVSGELFVCTDATSNNNIWVNVGAGIYDYGKCFGGLGGGTIAGFAAGSVTTGALSNGRIQTYSYTSDSDATNHGTLAQGVYMTAGSSSATHGYIASGVKRSDVANPIIERFAFATANSQAVVTNATIHTAKQDVMGHSSKTHGYCSGGNHPTLVNNIEKYAFGSSTTVADHGDLVAARMDAGSSSSISHGYTMGGNVSNTLIDRFSFASAGNAVTHSSLLTVGLASRRAGHSSNEYGFISGGNPTTNLVETFSFTSDSTATDHTNLHTATVAHGGSSSSTHGYITGGPDGVNSNRIQKFAFVNPGATGSDVANLVDAQNNYGHSECQF